MCGPPLRATDSLAANAIMSAQETWPGHSVSNTALTCSIASSFLMPKFLDDFISEFKPIGSRSIEASHPSLEEKHCYHGVMEESDKLEILSD